MKHISRISLFGFFAVLFILPFALTFTPLSTRADEESTSTPSTPPETQTPDPAPVSDPTPTPTPTPDPIPQIHVNVTVRYQSAVAYTGQVTLTQHSTETASDSSGSSHQIASDSALAALLAADQASPAFNLSGLTYYGSFDSFYVDCINIASAGKDECHNWQYVVDGSYPPMGADKYILADTDTLYVYFGNPRRVTLSSATSEKGSSITVRAESYNFTNDTWSPLSGAVIGATQPNPNDPYSPTVIQTVTTDTSGNAALTLATAGSYGIGLASDYYASLEPLTVTEPVINTAPQTNSSSSGGRSSSRSEMLSTTASTIASTTVSTNETLATTTSATIEDKIVTLDFSIERFIGAYNALSKLQPATVYKAIEPTPGVSIQATTTQAASPKTHWFGGVLKMFGF